MSLTISLVVPASTGGVRDYADILAHGLNGAGHSAQVLSWQQDDAGAIDQHIASSDCIYLQYSGYGFARRGAPLWMLRYLQERRSAIRRFGVFFHELYAFGPPWGSAFWLSPVQRHVAAGLARMADFWLTNREASHRWLMLQAPSAPNATLPVFSNVGESATFNPNRETTAVVFGGSALRQKTWRAAGKDIFDWANRHQLTLHDIGPPLADSALKDTLLKNRVIQHGRLEADAISRLLDRAKYGVLTYPVEYVAKSGVFAAYCSHGVAPLLISHKANLIDKLSANNQYCTDFSSTSSNEMGKPQVGEQAWLWYQDHSQIKQLKKTELLIDAFGGRTN